jgi:hypothetical protein
MNVKTVRIMKKIAILGVLALGLGTASCNKCTTCRKAGYEDQIECKQNNGPFSSLVDTYDADVNYWMEEGYECEDS